MEYENTPIDGDANQEQWAGNIPNANGEYNMHDGNFDEYITNLDSADQQALNDYVENLDLMNDPQLDAYLDHLGTQQSQYANDIDNMGYGAQEDPLFLQNLEPYDDTKRNTQTKKKSNNNGKNQKRSRKKRRVFPAIAMVVLILAFGIGGGWAVYHFTDIFPKEASRTKEPSEASTELAVTTEEATTEEEKYAPYAKTDYVLHTPHATENTIVFDSNPYSLRYGSSKPQSTTTDESGTTQELTQEDIYPAITLTPVEGSLNATSPDTANPAETQQMTSKYMVLVDLSDDSIVAKRDSDIVVNPASMTKILTVLTATDMIEDLDDTYVITSEAIHYAYEHDCSAVGFLEGETVTVKDLMYGTIVCSGADAAVGLALYCCGNTDAFVEKMNAKAAELGLSDTAHFTNVVGVYDENLHCTMEDMAVILSTAMQNDLCRDILNTRVYTTTPDPSLLPDSAKKSDNDTENTNDTDSEQTTDTQTSETDTSTDSTSGQTNTSDDNNSEDDEEEIDEGLLLVATTGIDISNWFMRRIEDKQTGGEVLGAKTGYVNASGFCAASYFKSASGKEYVCVTGDTYSSWRCIYDHVGIYRSLTK